MIPARSPEDLGMGRESPRPVQSPEPEAERPAFDLIYRSSIAYVLGMLWRLGVADRDREDVAHEVFLVVQRRLADYDPSLKLRPWLAGITWNVATRWKDLARHRRLELGMSDDEQESAADGHQDPEQLLSTAEVEVQLRALTRTLLQTVPDEQRIVLVMHDLDEIGMPDIARALGISPNTGWDRLRRARLSFEAAVRRLNERDRDALGASGIRPIPLLPIPFDPGAMLEHLRPLPELPAGLQERLWERLQQSTAGVPRDGGGDGSVSSAAAPTSAKLAGLAGVKLAAWSALVFVLGGGTGALLHTYAVTSGATEPTTAVLHDSAVVTSVATGASTGAVSLSAAALPSAASPASTAASSAPIESGEADTDGALMRRAGAALHTGKTTAALALLQRHAQKYPRSARGQEREALSIQALAVLPGKRVEANARAAQFRQAFPDSVFVPSIDSALSTVKPAP